jgi:hypothetical protein
MMELTEDFVKLLTIAFTVAGVLSIFFIFISYDIVVQHSAAEREANIVGDALLSDKCLTELDPNGYAIKSLFLEEKLDNLQTSCIKYYKIKFTIESATKSWEFEIGTPGEISATFDVAIKTLSGEIKPGELIVMV